jgi:hypothetical protein
LAFTEIVHVVVPEAVVQFGDPGVVFATTAGLGDAVPSVSTIETDCVLAETYFGEREAVVTADGILMLNATLCVLCGIVPRGAAGSDEPPPPEQAATRQPNSIAPSETSMFFRMSIAP